jgi:hypothetical protein
MGANSQFHGPVALKREDGPGTPYTGGCVSAVDVLDTYEARMPR